MSRNLTELIGKAAAKVGSEYKLAKALGVATTVVSDWKHERRTCSADDRARIAGFAGEDAVQELVRGTIENAKGEVRKAQLQQLLGKLLHPTGAALHSVALGGLSLTFGLSQVYDVLYTMYIM